MARSMLIKHPITGQVIHYGTRRSLKCPNCGEWFVAKSAQLQGLKNGKQRQAFCKKACWDEYHKRIWGL